MGSWVGGLVNWIDLWYIVGGECKGSRGVDCKV